MTHRPLRTACRALALGLAAWSWAPAHAAPFACPLASVSVTSPDEQDAADVCTAAAAVFAHFRELGYTKAFPLDVAITAALPEHLGPAMLGCFTPDAHDIRMLTFDSARARGPWFGRAIDRPLYRGLAAHELAHALAWRNTTGGPLSVRAREYVAFAVMFETLDAPLRQAILSEMPGPGFERDLEISDTYFYLAPARFGVDAYRHYLRPENGARFLREVLRGAALPVLDD